MRGKAYFKTVLCPQELSKKKTKGNISNFFTHVKL